MAADRACVPRGVLTLDDRIVSPEGENMTDRKPDHDKPGHDPKPDRPGGPTRPDDGGAHPTHPITEPPPTQPPPAQPKES